jgi:hypothetical protein
MNINLTSVALALLSIYVISKAYSFIRNYIAAVRTGYPVYITPVLSRSLAWMILGTMVMPYAREWLPEWIYARLAISTHG